MRPVKHHGAAILEIGDVEIDAGSGSSGACDVYE